MNNQLLPCPFCGGAAKSSVPFRGTQKAWCNAEGCENKSTFDVEAWNRRATQPAAGEPVFQLRNPKIGPEWHEVDDVQYYEFSSVSAYERRILWTVPPAAAGEPEQQTAINADDLPTKKYPLGAFDFAAPVAAGEPVYQWREGENERWWTTSKVDYEWTMENRPDFQVRILWTAPPAAANGDEAVRKDAERYRWLRGKSSSLALMMVANHSCGELDSEIDAAMRAQAGEGGEV